MPMNLGLILLLISAAIGVLCSILTLWTIYRLNRMNGYLKLILALTLSQLLYDISVLLVICQSAGLSVIFITIALRSMSGLWATFITNILSFVVLYTVWTSNVIDLAKNIRYILPILFIPSTIYGIIAPYFIFYSSNKTVHIVSSTYYWTRVASIIFNICSYLAMVYKLHQMDSSWLPSTQQDTSSIIRKLTQSPLWALAHRLKYYPIVQVITRLPVAIHEFNYGHDYEYPEDGTIREKISLLAFVIFLPAAGLGYFLVFITVCPGAFSQLINDLKFFICQWSDRKNPPLDQSRSNVNQEVISQLFSSRLSDTSEPYLSHDERLSIKLLHQRGRSSNMSERLSNKMSWHEVDSPARLQEYKTWSEDELVAEINRLYSIDRTDINRLCSSDPSTSNASTSNAS